ncbi:hypothetical protein K1719_038729 [Acacia pycnantha]|nr:hypothetical protein K1719_038729 [Acacia pycnantha]
MVSIYTNVTLEGVNQGLQSLEKGGIPAKFVIIDDGCQSVGSDLGITDLNAIEWKVDNAAIFANHFARIKENHKFRKDGKEGERIEVPAALGLRYITHEINENQAINEYFLS